MTPKIANSLKVSWNIPHLKLTFDEIEFIRISNHFQILIKICVLYWILN